MAPPAGGGMPPIDQLQGRPIGRVLTKMQKVTREQVVEALTFQKSKGGALGRILMDLGYIKEADLNVALAAQRGYELVNLDGVKIPDDFARYIVPKGSITVDGVSLTVANWNHGVAEIAVIPYTHEHTSIPDRKPGDAVNLEGDILGKYVERYLEARSSKPLTRISLAELTEQGF